MRLTHLIYIILSLFNFFFCYKEIISNLHAPNLRSKASLITIDWLIYVARLILLYMFWLSILSTQEEKVLIKSSFSTHHTDKVSPKSKWVYLIRVSYVYCLSNWKILFVFQISPTKENICNQCFQFQQRKHDVSIVPNLCLSLKVRKQVKYCARSKRENVWNLWGIWSVFFMRFKRGCKFLRKCKFLCFVE
jgi:hypothetical protein